MSKSNVIKIILVLALLSAFTTACSILNPTAADSDTPAPLVITETAVPASSVAEGHLVPIAHTHLGFATGGDVVEILVSKGDKVEAGQMLVTSKGMAQAQAAVAAAEAQVLDAQQAINTLNRTASLVKAQAEKAVTDAKKDLVDAQNNLVTIDSDTYQDDVDSAKEKVNDLKSDLDDAQTALDDVKDLNPDSQKRKDAETALEDAQKEYDQAVRDYDLLVNSKDSASRMVAVAKAHLEDANEEVSKVADGANKDDLALAQASLDQANAQLKAAQTSLAQTKISAPFASVVYEIYPEVDEYSAPGQTAVILANDSAWVIETNDLTELAVVDVSVGQEVKVSFDALPGKTFTGTVDEISRVATQYLGDVTYTVRILLPEIDERLRWGMTASVYLP